MPSLREPFQNDPEFDAELTIPIMRDAFGHVSAWHPVFKLVEIDTNLASVGNTDITVEVIDGERPFDDDYAVGSAIEGPLFDMDGCGNAVDGTPVFEEVLDRLAPLREDQVYVMSSHFLLGGAGVAEDFSIGGLVEYLGFMIQAQPLTRTRYISPTKAAESPLVRSSRFGQSAMTG